MGEEPYYLDKISKALEESVVEEDFKEFSSVIYYGADAEIEVVAASARQFPAMGQRQLVMLKEAQGMHMAKTRLDKLESYVAKPNKSTVLVIVYKDENLNSTSKLLKAAAKGGAVVYKSPRTRDSLLIGPIKEYCASIKIGIDEAAANLLAEYIGNPLAKLFGEIDKLKVAIGDDHNRISTADIEKYIGISKDYNNFELTKALTRRDYPLAMKIVKYFKSNPKNNPTVVTTGTLFNFFAKLVIVLFLPERSDKAMMEALDLKSAWSLSEIKIGMNFYNATQAVNAIHALREYDKHSKGIGSNQNEYDLLAELVFRISTL